MVGSRVRHVRWDAVGTIIKIETPDNIRVHWERKFPSPLYLYHPTSDLRSLNVVEQIGEIQL